MSKHPGYTTCHNHDQYHPQDEPCPVCNMRAEIERLRRDSDRHNAEWHDKVNENAANYHHRLAAEAEAARLREALMKIADMTSAAAWAPATGERWLDRIDETARAALGGQP